MNRSVSYKDFINIIKEEFNTSGAASTSRDNCKVTTALNILQGKWKNHILFEMCKHNSIRFGELKKALPEITNTMLTATLRELVAYGLVNRIQFNEIPPHVEYSLTEKGKDLIPIYYEIYQWALKYNI
ncbi:MAG: winged helix-turn-helix transcriptional regulator [Oscillospiraceae bacterium]